MRWKLTAFVLAVFAVTAVSAASNHDVVPRIHVEIDGSIDGAPIHAEWVLPADRQWALSLHHGTLRRVRSPFDTVYLPLSDGRGLAIHLLNIRFPISLGGTVFDHPSKREEVSYRLVDALTAPRVLQNCSPAPGCRITSRIRVLADGPVDLRGAILGGPFQETGGPGYGQLRRFGIEAPMPMPFASYQGALKHSAAFRSDPTIGPILNGVTAPAVVALSNTGVRRFWEVPGVSHKVGLVYRGGNAWQVPDRRTEPGDDSYWNAYRVDVIAPGDIDGIGYVRRDKRHLLFGRFEYRGGIVNYEPVEPIVDRIEGAAQLALVDPVEDVIVLLDLPSVGVSWIVRP